MGFKRIEIKPKEELKEVSLQNYITKASDYLVKDVEAVKSSNIVKWDEVGRQLKDIKQVGLIYALYPFDFTSDKNEFVLLIFANQSEYGNRSGLARVYVLNQDLSPQIRDGKPHETVIDKSYLFKHIGYACANF